jgi:hypothetical protein
MGDPETPEEIIASWLQHCGKPATHVFRRGDSEPHRFPNTYNRRICGQLRRSSRDYRDEIYLCESHNDSNMVGLIKNIFSEKD